MAVVAIRMDGVGRGEEIVAGRLYIHTNEFHKNASLISVRRNPLRGLRNSANRSRTNSLAVSKCDKHLLVVAIAGN
jgi:hypothetical protein